MKSNTSKGFYVRSANGRDAFIPEEIIAQQKALEYLSERNFGDDEFHDLRISSLPLPTEAAVPRENFPRLDSSTLPPIPRPRTPFDILPTTSDEVLIAKANVELFLYTPAFLQHYWSANALPVGPLTPPLPKDIQLGYKAYWERVDTQHITGPQQFTRTETIKIGMSSTSMASLSGELGVNVNFLSGKLTETLTHSITTTQESDTAITYSVSVDKGTVMVWTLWQLVEVYALLDAQGNETTYSGTAPFQAWGPPGKVQFLFPATRVLNHVHEAWPDSVSFPAA
jgi:hypothetical protein